MRSGERLSFDEPNPFTGGDSSEEVASRAYRYRRWTLNKDEGVDIVVRCELDGAINNKVGRVGGSAPGSACAGGRRGALCCWLAGWLAAATAWAGMRAWHGAPAAHHRPTARPTAPTTHTMPPPRRRRPAAAQGEEQLLSIKALSEFDLRASEWRKKMEMQRGAMLALETKNNKNKVAKWTAAALLAGADMLKLGYVSRAGPRDNQTHVILGTQVRRGGRGGGRGGWG